MTSVNHLAGIGALIGDPARAAMLDALMGGKALTASELARAAGITPQTASGHLAKLTEAEMLAVERQGRHRYHRLASPEIARLIEQIMQLSPRDARPAARKVATGPRDRAMRTARTCYDHLAGHMAVAIADALVAQEIVAFEEDGGVILDGGLERLAVMGLDLTGGTAGGTTGGGKPSRRPVCRPCLDWSERRPHLAGRLGAAICSHAFEKGWIRRINETRAVRITPAGELALREMFRIDRAHRDPEGKPHPLD